MGNSTLARQNVAAGLLFHVRAGRPRLDFRRPLGSFPEQRLVIEPTDVRPKHNFENESNPTWRWDMIKVQEFGILNPFWWRYNRELPSLPYRKPVNHDSSNCKLTNSKNEIDNYFYKKTSLCWYIMYFNSVDRAQELTCEYILLKLESDILLSLFLWISQSSLAWRQAFRAGLFKARLS